MWFLIIYPDLINAASVWEMINPDQIFGVCFSCLYVNGGCEILFLFVFGDSRRRRSTEVSIVSSPSQRYNVAV